MPVSVLVLVLFLVLHVMQKLLNVLFAPFNNVLFRDSQTLSLVTDVSRFISGIGFSLMASCTATLKTSAFVFFSRAALRTSDVYDFE